MGSCQYFSFRELASTTSFVRRSQRPQCSLQRPPLACAVRGRACQLQARRCCVGRPRELVLRVNLKRYGSSRLDDKLHPPSGASTTCRSAMVECRSTAGSRANGTRFLLASLQLQACRCAPLPTSFTSLQGGGLPPRRVQPGPTRPCCAALSPPARSGCLCGTLIAARASNTPSRCAGR